MSHLNKFLKTVFGIPLTVLALIFIARILFSYRQQVFDQLFHIQYGLLILSAGLYGAFFFIKGYVWYRILKKQGIAISPIQSLYIYSFSELRRYIPGNVFSFLSRGKYLGEHGVPVKASTKAILAESAVLVASSLLVSVPALVFIFHYIGHNLDFYNRFGIATQLTVIIFLAAVIGVTLILYILMKLFNRFKITQNDYREYLKIIFVEAFAWCVFGLGGYCSTVSLHFVTPQYILQYSSFFVLAWLVGYLAVIFPMGLGVREGVITEGLVLLATVPQGIAAAIAIISRIVLIFTELVSVCILWILVKYQKQIATRFKGVVIQTFLLWSGIAAYSAYFTYVTFEKHLNYFTGRFDLGNMDQTVWNTLHGRIFMLTNPDSTNIISRLSIHADFILILLAPLYVIWQDPRMLLLIQTVCVALGAYFVYRLTEIELKNKNLALVFALSYLLNPIVQKQNLYDFHAITLATTFLLGAFYFLKKKNMVSFFVFLVLAVLTKEDVYLIAAFFGGYLVRKNRKRLGIALIGISMVIFYLLVTQFIPGARGGQHFALSYFTDFGDSPGAILRSFFVHPTLTISHLFMPENLSYLFKVFLPTGFLALFAPFYLLFASAQFAINLLSQNGNFKSIDFQYSAAIVPFVYIASMYGVKNLHSYLKKITMNYFVYYVAFFAILATWMFGTLPGSQYPALEIYIQRLSIRSDITNYINTIPQKYSVAATNNLGVHLSHREKIYTIPSGLEKADIILFLLNDQFAQPSLNQQVNMVAKLKKDPKYREVFEDPPFFVFKRQ